MQKMTPVDRFITEILQGGDDDVKQYSAHEAGHRFMWRLMFPDVRTYYGYKGGLHAVLTENPPDLVIRNIDQKTAAGHAHVKLAGFAAEMRMLGLGGAWEEIGKFLVEDYNAIHPRLDWMDDWEHHGDIPEAMNIISLAAGRASLAANLPRFIHNCLFMLDAEAEAYQVEWAEAIAFFRKNGGKKRIST